MTPTYIPVPYSNWPRDRETVARVLAERAAIRLGLAGSVDTLARFRLFVAETRGSSPGERAMFALRYQDIGAARMRARALARLHERRIAAYPDPGLTSTQGVPGFDDAETR